MPDLQSSLDLCTYCPRLCSHTCPVSLVSARESLTPQSKMQSFALLRRAARSEPADSPAPDTLPDATPVYGCTGCGACTVPCLYKVEPASALMSGRAELERLDLGHPALAALPQAHAVLAAQTAAALAQDPVLAGRAAPAGGTAYLPACAEDDSPASLHAAVREAQTALRLLDRIRAVDASVALAGVAVLSAASAGYPLYAAGFAERFRLFAESFARDVEKYETLLVGDARSAWLLRVLYPEYGVPLRPQILHIAEYLGPLAPILPVTAPQPAAYYHDACHLGRRLRCYDAPRDLLRRALVEVRELVHHSDGSRCCGAGGVLPETDPDVARGMATERLAEREASAPVVSACVACARHMAGSEAGGAVLTLLEVLDAATAPAAAG